MNRPIRTTSRLLLALALLSAACLPLVAFAQHGQGLPFEQHFEAIANRLELSQDQRDAVEAPLREMFDLMEQFHRAHGEVAAELTDEQRQSLSEMLPHHLPGGMRHDGGLHGQGSHGQGPHGQGLHEQSPHEQSPHGESLHPRHPHGSENPHG